MPNVSAAASKAALRDSMNRLRSIRKRCGKEDEEAREMETTGDPFRDKTAGFIREINNLKEMIAERNADAAKLGQDHSTIEQSHLISRGIQEQGLLLSEMKALVDSSERDLAEANRKKKAPNKIRLKEQTLKEREAMFNQCKDTLENVRSMNEQRFNTGGGKGGSSRGPQSVIGKKMLLREQLLSASKARADGASEATPEGPTVRLEDAPETKEQMQILHQQEKKINAGLDRLTKGVARLHELAIQIGSEVELQNRKLDATENQVDSQNKELRQLNKRINKLIKETKPLNLFLNIGCFLLLLALVGYFLFEFNVV